MRGLAVDGSCRVLVVIETVRERQPPSQAAHDGKGLSMKKFTLAAVAALAVSAMPAFAADMPAKAARIGGSASAAGLGPGLRFGDRQRLCLARHHAVEPQAVGRGLLRAALQHQQGPAALRRYRWGEHLVPEPRGGRGRFLRRFPSDLRQVRVRLRRLVLLVPGRPVLQRGRADDGCSANGSCRSTSTSPRPTRASTKSTAR